MGEFQLPTRDSLPRYMVIEFLIAPFILSSFCFSLLLCESFARTIKLQKDVEVCSQLAGAPSERTEFLSVCIIDVFNHQRHFILSR